MACSKVTVNVFKCLVVLCAFLASTTQGRSSHRIHNRHHGLSRSPSELEFEREMIDELERDLSSHNSRTQHSAHRGHYEGPTENLRPSEDRYRRRLPSSLERLQAIAKRHNDIGNSVKYVTMSDDEEAKLQGHIYHRGMLDKPRKSYEVEVKEAQNSSLCNYTVIDIPDMSKDQSRIPKKLFHVKCNHAESRCRHTGTYYCTQTYSYVEVSYSNGTPTPMKIYTGCVCSLRSYGELSPHETSISHEWGR